ncbi:hypothetical protein EDL96_06615 [Kocuria soli]|uniref:Uncharacterized protein n=1 Tax=Kocuria soli TaxID=2485125 RepID=A0A3N3ZY04_9MICC|nr:hypothetical protein EDL96_06615 [Kocuria soli]
MLTEFARDHAFTIAWFGLMSFVWFGVVVGIIPYTGNGTVEGHGCGVSRDLRVGAPVVRPREDPLHQGGQCRPGRCRPVVDAAPRHPGGGARPFGQLPLHAAPEGLREGDGAGRGSGAGGPQRVGELGGDRAALPGSGPRSRPVCAPARAARNAPRSSDHQSRRRRGADCRARHRIPVRPGARHPSLRLVEEQAGGAGDLGPAQARLGTVPEAHPRWAGLR